MEKIAPSSLGPPAVRKTGCQAGWATLSTRTSLAVKLMAVFLWAPSLLPHRMRQGENEAKMEEHVRNRVLPGLMPVYLLGLSHQSEPFNFFSLFSPFD